MIIEAKGGIVAMFRADLPPKCTAHLPRKKKMKVKWEKLQTEADLINRTGKKGVKDIKAFKVGLVECRASVLV